MQKAKASHAARESKATALRGVRVLAGLDEPHFEALAHICEWRTVEARTQLNAATETDDRVLFVLQGMCRVMAIAPRGCAATLCIARAGDGVNLAEMLPGAQMSYGATQLVFDQPTTFVRVPRAALLEHLRASPTTLLTLMHSVCASALEAQERYFELATLDVRGRLLAELTRLALRAWAQEQTSARVVLEAAPTHNDLGEHIGAAREAVTRQLNLLEDAGVVQLGRKHMVIANVHTLMRLYEAASGRRIAVHLRPPAALSVGDGRAPSEVRPH